ncbi:cytochrome-c peroxidase [Fluviicola taffensis]|uniref:Cytochrome-c peroxidase n=1 Tax=Fluviicola taffensis (strain DSM 16823 / NCIMB 13979 / RW262) TaxID=755732 RepID=F2IHM2_FLUTR|nr:cytochrome c peroxidase [Fluviicola taffensis]AEA44800.1 Cytochrome-c peroxidase [Fluviicola taffensis DSM 16823]
MKKVEYACLLLFTLIMSSFLFVKIFEFPASWPKPIYDFKKNPLDESKIELGRALFYDPILSLDSSISCASCHSSYVAFTHVDHKLSHGISDRIGTRNTPALMNLAWQTTFMWDGAVNHLDMQALAPISHSDEMGSDIKVVVQKLQRVPFYQHLFEKAYGTDKITGERVLKSLSQFMLTLVSCNSKYDKVKRNEAAFSDQENRGYSLFKQHCAGCHSEPLFTSHKFANNGLTIDTSLNDLGRMKQTGSSSDSLCFKIPTLRNAEYSFPYMHDGRFKKLSEVLNHYDSGIQSSKSLAKELQKSFHLTSQNKVDLIAFLLTLSDRDFVMNQKSAYPKELFSTRAKESIK